MTELAAATLKTEAGAFAKSLSGQGLEDLYGITDGKAVGTYVEIKFHDWLKDHGYTYAIGNAANGIDFPALGVDVKATSIRQPQSSCPYRAARQKVYGLGYDLLVFVYEKHDEKNGMAILIFKSVVFVNREQTADYQTSRGLREILDRGGNRDDVIAFLEERNLPLDEIGRDELAQEILRHRPVQGYLTISNALQWRLQYKRIVDLAAGGKTPGVEPLV